MGQAVPEERHAIGQDSHAAYHEHGTHGLGRARRPDTWLETVPQVPQASAVAQATAALSGHAPAALRTLAIPHAGHLSFGVQYGCRTFVAHFFTSLPLFSGRPRPSPRPPLLCACVLCHSTTRGRNARCVLCRSRACGSTSSCTPHMLLLASDICRL